VLELLAALLYTDEGRSVVPVRVLWTPKSGLTMVSRLIGLLAGRNGDVNPYTLMPKRGNLHGIFVGDRPMFVEMNKAIEASGIRPVVDTVFAFDDALAAYRHQLSGKFVGKVVIRM